MRDALTSVFHAIFMNHIIRHLPTFHSMYERVEIVAVHDRKQESAEKIAEKYNIPMVAESFEEMLGYIDAAVICTPNKFHAEMAVAALEAGIHVFCEKPMALTGEESKKMVDAARKSEKILFIGYHYRFMQESQAAKQWIEAGEIGNPLVVKVEALRRRKVPGWGVFTNKSLQGGGCLIDFGCHHLDLALWFLGNPIPIEVSGSTYNELSKSRDQVNVWGAFDPETFDVEDHATAYIRFENGATLFLETSWAANVENDLEKIRVSGDQGGLDVFPLKIYQAKHGMLLDQVPNWLPGPGDPAAFQAINFVESCLGIAEPIVKPEQALQTARIIDAIYESSELGRSVTVG